MKILIFIPWHSSKFYAINHLFKWLTRAELPSCEVIIRCDLGEYNKDQAIKRQREVARTYAVQNDFTHLLFLDADTIPPLDVIPRLLQHDEAVVGAVYHGRIQDTPGETTTAAWLQTDPNKQFLKQKGLIKVDGMGMGCVMLSRRAFTAFSFNDWENPSDDYPAFEALQAKGFNNMLDTTLICKHYESRVVYH